jgi:cytochrome c556
MRRVGSALFWVLMLASLAAQSPRGWVLRADRSTSASDPDAPGDIKFLTEGSGFHAINPQAAVFWNPTNTAAGDYSLKGAFTLMKPSNHTNYYGLVFGGSDLEGAAQTYMYFLVAQDGTWLVKRRQGDAATQNLLPKTASDSVRKPNASGQSTNALEVRVTADAIEFVVNGTVVNTWFGARRAVKTDGIYGIRVNHFLDVQVDGFAVAAPAAASARLPARAAMAPANEVSNGETVTMTATVDQVLSPTAFGVIEERTKSTGQDVLILAPTLRAPLDRNASVTVFGEMVKFDPAEVARKVKASTIDISDERIMKYRGRPAVIATAVLNDNMVDVAKPLPPPITADDQMLSQVMKRVAPAFEALRQAADRSNPDALKQNAVVLGQAFTEIEAFWRAKARTDAATWAQDARRQAESIARDATSGRLDSVKTSADTLGQQCRACHATYREQVVDGSFRIKAASAR